MPLLQMSNVEARHTLIIQPARIGPVSSHDEHLVSSQARYKACNILQGHPNSVSSWCAPLRSSDRVTACRFILRCPPTMIEKAVVNLSIVVTSHAGKMSDLVLLPLQWIIKLVLFNRELFMKSFWHKSVFRADFLPPSALLPSILNYKYSYLWER